MCKRTICLILLLVSGLAGTLSAGETVKINFQLAGAPVPEGYLPDTGLMFGDRGNGYSYGWNRDMTGETRDRNNAAAPDQRYDTLIHFRDVGAVWEIALEPGTYRVHIVCGDPSNADSNNPIVLEGQLLSLDPDGLDNFDEFNFTIAVTDGRLSWSSPAGSYVKACFIDIESTRPIVKATQPDPKDGSLLTATWASLGWTPGQLAVSHDVYMGESFEDVNAGTGNTFRGNQPSPLFLVGLGMPGDPYPAGLVPGTTYYWRVDEVNQADPNSPWKGPVWSFSILPQKAHAPSPRSGAKYVDTAPTLTWAAGLNAKLHYVSFGDNLDTITNATGGTPLGMASYTPAGPLAKGKTYYWRVDEFDGAARHKGDVWSFTTMPDIPVTDPNMVAWYKFEIGEGTRIIDFSGHNNNGTITGTVPWVDSLFNLGLEFTGDNGGYVTLPAGTIGLTNRKGSVAMWINTHQTDDEGMIWYACDATGGDGFGGEDEIHVNMDDDSGGQIRLFMEGNDGGSGDASVNVGWSYNDQWIHVAATWDPTDGLKLYINGVLAGSAAHGNVGNLKSYVSMRLGHANSGDRKYDGLLDDVRLFNYAISATKVAEIMNKGEDPLRAGSPKPATGALAPINEAASLTWSRGDKASQHDVYFGLDKAAVANAAASDTTGVYRGRQSVTSYIPSEGVQFNSGPYYWRVDEVNTDGTITTGAIWSFSVAGYALVEDFESYNDIAAGQAGNNLVYMTWLDGFGTTTNGSTMGYPTGSSLETARVHSGGKAVPLIYNNATASFSEVERTLAAQNWTSNGIQTLSLWFYGDAASVPGQLYVKINGVKVPYDGDAGNLKKPIWQTWNITLASVGTNLQSVTRLAIGIETKGTSGTLLLDDIRLYPLPRQLVTPVQPDPAGLAARYAFEGNANDGVGGHNGVPTGGPLYAAGKFGQAISLDGVDDHVVVGTVGISGTAPRTIAGWAKASTTTFPAWINIFGFTGPSGNNGHFDIELVGDSGTVSTLGWYGLHVYGWERNILPVDSDWHHLAASYDGTTIRWYGDGVFVGSASRVLNTPDNVHIGKRQDNTNYFPGSVDEVQIYSRALSDAEIAGLAGVTKPFDEPF